MTQIVIVSARRTPQGKFLGALARRTAAELAIAAARAAMADLRIAPEKIDSVIVGNVLSAGLGQNVSRQIALGTGLPLETPAFSVNMMCASGMQAVLLAAQAIRAGDGRVILCGGTESMSNAPYLLDRARSGYKLGDATVIDSILRDGLVDAFHHEHMGLGAEALAEKYNITRIQQDQFAADSQQKYGRAHSAGRFTDEITPLDNLAHDEHPRPDTTAEKLATLKPAFKPTGGVTAGNASGINDGAAMLIVCSAETALREGWKPLATLSAGVSIGCDPRMFGLGPALATRRLCAAHNLDLHTFDTVELNEAFAAQSLAYIKDLALDPACVNIDGGAIALGHPIGASGARLLVHLAHRIRRGETKRALATLCVGGGMGIAAALEA